MSIATFKQLRIAVVGNEHGAKFRPNRHGIPAYRSGDRCGFCGNGAFIIGRHDAQCTNSRCEMTIPLERA